MDAFTVAHAPLSTGAPPNVPNVQWNLVIIVRRDIQCDELMALVNLSALSLFCDDGYLDVV